MNFNLQKFADALQAVPELKEPAGFHVNDELLEHFLRPLLAGRDITLGSLNFDEIDEEDIDALQEYLDDLYRSPYLDRVLRVLDCIRHAVPHADLRRLFC